MSENAVREEGRPNVLDFTGQTVIGLTGTGITSINGDNATAQVLNGSEQIGIVDNGGGIHTFRMISFVELFPNGGSTEGQNVPVPVGVETPLIHGVVNSDGWYLIVVKLDLTIPNSLLGSTAYRVSIFVNAIGAGETVRTLSTGVNINGLADTCFGRIEPRAAGDIVTVTMMQDSANTINVNATLTLVRLGSIS